MVVEAEIAKALAETPQVLMVVVLLRSRADDLILEELTRATEVDTAEEAKVAAAETRSMKVIIWSSARPLITDDMSSTQVLLRSVAKKC